MDPEVITNQGALMFRKIVGVVTAIGVALLVVGVAWASVDVVDT